MLAPAGVCGVFAKCISFGHCLFQAHWSHPPHVSPGVVPPRFEAWHSQHRHELKIEGGRILEPCIVLRILEDLEWAWEELAASTETMMRMREAQIRWTVACGFQHVVVLLRALAGQARVKFTCTTFGCQQRICVDASMQEDRKCFESQGPVANRVCPNLLFN